MGKTRTKAADKQENDILEREKKSLQLRKAGASYRAIGEQLGVSHIQARRDVEQALSYIRDDVAQDARKLRDLELARLDDDLLKLQDYINGERVLVRDGSGNPVKKIDGSDWLYEVKRFAPATVLAAIDRKLKISERRSKLLGLDMPLQVEQVTAETKMIDAIRKREFDYATVLDIVDNDTSLAEKLFQQAGVPIER